MKKFLDQDGVLFLIQKIKIWLSGKVDKVEGKGLSTNDFTNEDKQKLDSLTPGGGVTNFEDLQNIPENLKPYETLVHDANYNHTDNNYTDADKAKIQTLPETVGDMTKATYDTDGDGIVDKAANAMKVNNLTVETAVPPSAVFTDTTYEKATTSTDGLMSSTDKAKLDKIEENANYFALEAATSKKLGGVKIGTGVNVADDGTISVNIPTVPTKVSELTNDSKFQTESQVDEKISNIKIFSVTKVDSLPEVGEENKLYLISSSEKSESNIYDEYLWVDSAFEKIGSTKIDLTNYWSKEELVALTNEELEQIISDIEGA